MFKYFPANKDIKQMSANGIKITSEGYRSSVNIPELESLVQAGILVKEEVQEVKVQEPIKEEPVQEVLDQIEVQEKPKEEAPKKFKHKNK
jgi:hypothetical protein